MTDLRQGNLLSEAGATKVLAAAAEVEAQLGTPAPQAVTEDKVSLKFTWGIPDVQSAGPLPAIR